MNNSKNGRMAYAAIIVMSSMVLSRFTGFLREAMLSWKVGLSWVQDAYIAAFTVPDLMYFLLVGGMISAALVPFLSGHLETGEEEEGWKAASSFINTVIAGLLLMSVLGVIFAPQIIPAVAPGFSGKSPQTKELAVSLSRIIFPSVSFIMLAGICNGILNSYKKFALAAYGPSIYNAGCALSIYIFADTNPDSMKKAAIGVAVSAFVYFTVQLAFSLPMLKLYKPLIDFRDGGFQKLVKQAVPSLMSSSVAQVNVIISTAFVSLSATEGGLSAFRNANTLWQLPYGIFAMGVGTAMLPTLSGKYAAGGIDGYRDTLTKSLNSVLFVAIPSSVGFIILGKPIVRAVFMWGGRFTEADIPAVAYILAFFSLSMITQSAVAIINRAFYALQDTKTPLFVGIGSIIMNLALGSLFYRFTDLKAAGMALAYTIISTVNSILLLKLLNRKVRGIYMGKFIKLLRKSVPSAAVMGIALLVSEPLLPEAGTKAGQLACLAVEIIAGALVYVIMMLLLKSEEALYFLNKIKSRVHGWQ